MQRCTGPSEQKSILFGKIRFLRHIPFYPQAPKHLRFCGTYRNYRYAEALAELFDIDRSAVCPDFVHHIQCQHHRQVQLQKLQGQIEIPLNICGVNYIDYSVGLAVEYKVSRNYLLLCIRSYRIDAGKVDNGAVFCPLYASHFLVNRNARKISDVLI